MDGAWWERIQALFHEAADRPPAQRLPYLKVASGGDERLIADVQALLDEDARGSSLIDRGVAQAAGQMLGQTAVPALPFQEFGPYRMLEVLGEGGMGVVYLAERDDLGSLVAVKILRDAWMSPARRDRFAGEQRTLAQMTHPSIARLYDAGTLSDGTPWFAMELVKGVPLTEYCGEHRSSITERLSLFRSVCEAVQYAHSRAVIHRDLKPSNILVESAGSVKLLDFGIARQLDRDGTPPDRTRTGLRLMTPAYAAPEQIRGEPAGIYTDVYALGVILYELLAGQLPFDVSTRTPGEVEAMIVNHEPEKPSLAARRRSGVERTSPARKTSWADLDVLCLKAMHKDPQRRYGSVEAFIRDIDRYLRGAPLEAQPDTLRYRMGKFIGRNRRGVTAAALASVVLVALVIFFTAGLAIERNAALVETARAQRIQRFTLNLFTGGDKEAGPADNLRVLDLLDRGVQEAKALDREPSAQADLYRTLGGIYQKLGKFDKADTLLRAALEQRRTGGKGDGADLAESQVALGLLRSDQARLDEAEQLVRSGLESARRLRPPANKAVAEAMLALGQVLRARGRFAESIGVLEQAMKLESGSRAPTPELAAALSSLADSHHQSGHFDIAKSLDERAMEMHRRLFGDRHPSIASDLLSLADIQQQLGYYREAERLARQALDINRAYYGDNHPQTADNLTVLGRALVFEKRFDEGEDSLRRALVIRERVYGKVHPFVAETLNELGGVAYMRDQWDEAEAQFRRMIDIYLAVYHGRHNFQIAVGEANLASVYLDRKEYPRAEQLFRSALQLYIETLGPDHVNTGVAHLKLGRTLLREGRYRDAEKETLAGYAIMIRQANPAESFLRGARKDLRAIYQAIGQPEKAAAYQEPAMAKAARAN